jgi:hypothetical protein
LTVDWPELGLGAEAVFSAGGRGTVAATFARAAYLRLPAGLVALTTFDVPPGPIHARGRVPIDRLSPGDRVTVGDGKVQAGDVSVGLTGAAVWHGTLPAPAALAAASDLALELLDGVPTALTAPLYEPRVRRSVECLERGDLAGVVEALAGLGPGLTPAGDDALAGILLLARHPSAVSFVDGARTNEVAQAFLAWAARGQSIEPVHRFLATVAGGDRPGGRAALRTLVRFGHSSGADLAYGLRLAFEHVVAPGR